MIDGNKQSRSNKFEKRRKNTKKISILMIVASILILFLLILWLFGGEDKDTSTPDNGSNELENLEKEENLNDDNQDETNTENNGETEGHSSENSENDVIVEDTEINENADDEEDIEVETEQVDPSDDNVIEAYTGNWQPIGTVQEGPHTTVYDTGSQDRIEIKQAVMSATGLGEDLTEHWVGNGGDQKVVATVSDNSEIYRVNLSWVDQQGWQVTKVERLKEVES